jgi:hypothetical protein
MPWIKLPGGLGTAFFPGTEKQAAREQKLINARHEFTLAYMKEKGWGEDPAGLSIYQLLEIRAQPGWQDPLNEAN